MFHININYLDLLLNNYQFQQNAVSKAGLPSIANVIPTVQGAAVSIQNDLNSKAISNFLLFLAERCCWTT